MMSCSVSPLFFPKMLMPPTYLALSFMPMRRVVRSWLFLYLLRIPLCGDHLRRSRDVPRNFGRSRHLCRGGYGISYDLQCGYQSAHQQYPLGAVFQLFERSHGLSAAGRTARLDCRYAGLCADGHVSRRKRKLPAQIHAGSARQPEGRRRAARHFSHGAVSGRGLGRLRLGGRGGHHSLSAVHDVRGRLRHP